VLVDGVHWCALLQSHEKTDAGQRIGQGDIASRSAVRLVDAKAQHPVLATPGKPGLEK
jgi:hypothetical protein